MSKPTVTDTAAGYMFLWDEEELQIDVSRLYTHSDGRTTGEIAITTTADGMHPHIHQAQFNFSGSKARRDLANILNDRYTADWNTILEQLVVITLDRIRKGEPVEELWTSKETQQPEYIIYPLIIRNYPNVIFGDPSAGKSTLAVILTQVMMLPWQDNPLGLNAPPQCCKCLYLDWEADAETLRWQTTMLERGIGSGDLCLYYRRCSMPLAQDVTQLRLHIESCTAEVVVIDSLGLAAGGDLNTPQSALDFFTGVRQLKCTTLILAHNAKDPNNKSKTIYGSQFFTAQARNIWELKKQQDSGANELNLALFHRKPPPFSKLHNPIGIRLSFDNDQGSMSISKQDPYSVADFVEGMNLQYRICDLLKRGAYTSKEIAEELDYDYNNIRQTINRLKRQNKIVSLEGHRYGLSTPNTI